ncbi:MAG TPA: ABC transporter substrate-binding protein [Steroidobacteraceae bacterium]|nr:ABC transporter substrate-binding protein [Steroidobacteraceae bacterium]
MRAMRNMCARLTQLLICLGVAVPLLVGTAHAALDPAVGQITSLDNALLESMKAGATLTVTERYRRLAPVIELTFDLPTMTAFAVGSAWAKFSADQQQATIAAFTRLTIASYAHNFAGFDGQRFEINSDVVVRGVDKIVRTRLTSPHSASVDLMYRMRESSGSWKIIDVYYGAISQLTTRRADFAASITSGGASSLVAHLNSLSDDLLR